jgi:KAP family P-loop domain
MEELGSEARELVRLQRTWVALYGQAGALAQELDARGWEVSAVDAADSGEFLGPSESGTAPHVVVARRDDELPGLRVAAVDALPVPERLGIAALATAASSVAPERAVVVTESDTDVGETLVDGVERALAQLGFATLGPALAELRLEGSGEPVVLHEIDAELARLLVGVAAVQGDAGSLIDFATLFWTLIENDPERWFADKLPLAEDGRAALRSGFSPELARAFENQLASWRDRPTVHTTTLITSRLQTSVSVRERFRWATLVRAALVRGGARRATLQLDDLMGAYLFIEPGEHRRDMQRWFGKSSEGDEADASMRVGEARLKALAESFIGGVASRWPEELHVWKERFFRRFGSQARLMRLDIAPSAHIASDRWTTKDELGYRAYALAIAAFLKHPKSQPPLTISIQAPWGGGKTSVMRMLAEMLDPVAAALPQAQQAVGVKSPGLTLADVAREFGGGVPWWMRLGRSPAGASPESTPVLPASTTQLHAVWFNAWKYQSLNQVWAGISKAILVDLTAKLPAAQRELFWLRLNLARVDTGQVRRRVHEQLLQLALRAAGRAAAWLVGGLAAALGALALYLLPAGSAMPWLGSGGAGALAVVAAVAWLRAAQRIASGLRERLETAPPKDLLDKLVREPDYDKEAGFVHHAAEDLQRVFALLPADHRLVVFIDDLDRCSPQHVAAVTEAINLFLAGDFPSCYFVIGMDTTLVAAALDVAHQAIGARLHKGGSMSMGWRFMDKFVQLPLVLPRPQAEVSRRYLGSLMPQASARRLPAPANVPDASTGVLGAIAAADGRHVDQTRLPQRVSDLRDTDTSGRALPEEIDALAREGQQRFRDEDPEFADSLARLLDLFGGNPRETKRLVNTFRFQCYVALARKRTGLAVPPLHLLARWVAVGLCWPEFVSWYRHQDEAPVGTARLRAAGMRNADEFAELGLLPLLEVLARSVEQGAIDGWGPWLSKLYGVDEAQAWVRDRRLTALLAQDQRDDSERLSSAAGTGFW